MRSARRPRQPRVHRLAHRVALYQHGVHHALDVGDQALAGDQRRVNPQFDARAGTLAYPPRNAEQLDPVAEFFGITDIVGGQRRDAFGVCPLELHRHAEGDRRHDGQLVPGIDALDVEGRIGFRVAELLRLRENRVEREPLVAHLGQDEVAGTVDDARDPFDAVRGETLAQRLDDRDATADGCLESHHHALGLRSAKDLVAVQSKQRLVCGDHVLAVGDRLEDQLFRDAVAADQFDDDIDVRIAHDRESVVDDLCRRLAGRRGAGHQRTRAHEVLVRHARDAYPAPGAPFDLVTVAREHPEGAPAHGTDAQQTYVDRFHQSSPSLRNISFTPRVAWRMRDSFSISASRTWSSPYSPKPMPGDAASLASSSSFFENSSEPIFA